MRQSQALDVLRCGANVFLTGEPGSGKTYTLKCYLRWLGDRRIERAVTASTGIAATHLGGVTVHSWSGIGVQTEVTAAQVEHVRSDLPQVARRVRSARVLVIDEISMLSAATLDAVDAMCRALRGDDRPLGGMQVVFVGDFFQLPPVPSRETDSDGGLSLLPKGPTSGDFAFNSAVWKAMNPAVCYLSEQHRHRDAGLSSLLGALRLRAVTGEHRALLGSLGGRPAAPGAVLLYAHNADADRINEAELEKIEGATRAFEMQTQGPMGLVAALAHGCTSPARLVLKVGAKVLFTRNDHAGGRWVNGTLGTVAAFDREQGLPVVRTRCGEVHVVEPAEWSLDDGGKTLASLRQIPLRLAWAITVHKSQGMSLDAAHVDLSRAFAYGQGYVALSRVRTLEGLTVEGCNTRALEVDPGIAARDAGFRARSEGARRYLEKLAPEVLKARREAWVLACGGTPEGKAPARSASTPAPAGPPRAKRRRGRKGRQDPVERKGPGWERTIELLREGRTIDDVARERGRTAGTIVAHLENAASEGRLCGSDIAHLGRVGSGAFREIHEAMAAIGVGSLSALHGHLGGRYTYDQLRIARLLLVSRDQADGTPVMPRPRKTGKATPG